MKECRGCGASNPADAQYCNVCGHRLRDTSDVMRRMLVWVLSAACLGLAGLWVATWLELRQARSNLAAHDTLTAAVSHQYKTSLDSLREEYYRLDAQKCSAEHRLTDFQEMVGRCYPLIIDSIKIANVNRMQQVQSDFGSTIYSDETMYLQPRIYYRGIKHGAIDLYVKWLDEDGRLRTGENSPVGYSQRCEMYVYEENKTMNLKGWGSESRGNWRRGRYQLEVWCNGMLLAKKQFSVI